MCAELYQCDVGRGQGTEPPVPAKHARSMCYCQQRLCISDHQISNDEQYTRAGAWAMTPMSATIPQKVSRCRYCRSPGKARLSSYIRRCHNPYEAALSRSEIMKGRHTVSAFTSHQTRCGIVCLVYYQPSFAVLDTQPGEGRWPLPARPGAKSDAQKCVRRGRRPLPVPPGAKSDVQGCVRRGQRPLPPRPGTKSDAQKCVGGHFQRRDVRLVCTYFGTLAVNPQGHAWMSTLKTSVLLHNRCFVCFITVFCVGCMC